MPVFYVQEVRYAVGAWYPKHFVGHANAQEWRVQEVRSKNVPCIFDISTIHGGRTLTALRGVSLAVGAWYPKHFVGHAKAQERRVQEVRSKNAPSFSTLSPSMAGAHSPRCAG